MNFIVRNTSLPSEPWHQEYSDPEFLKMAKMSMTGSPGYSSDVIANKLSHKITRSPKDLRSHTQRIIIFIEQSNALAVYSGLIDLFLVLENKGLALRKRMLLSAKPLLSAVQFDLLHQSLAHGLLPEHSFTDAKYSLLNWKRQGTQAFIEKRINQTPEISLIDEVNSYLEYGQIDQARLLLQKMIVDEPEQISYHQELLAIFRKLGDSKLFSNFHKELLGRNIDLPIIWAEVATEFNDEKPE